MGGKGNGVTAQTMAGTRSMRVMSHGMKKRDRASGEL